MNKIILGKPFDKKTKHDFRETCFGICVKDEKILLSFNANKNEYSLPGGGIEQGETHKSCLARELAEETGYKLKLATEFLTIDCFWLAGNVWPMESLANFYIIDVNKNFAPPTEAFYQAVWLPIAEALNLLQLPYQHCALEYFINTKQKTEN